MRMLAILLLLFILGGCASVVLVKDCNKVYDRNGGFTGQQVCVKPGWF